MLRILYVNFYQDGYWLEEMTATLARFSFHICLGLLAIVGCGGTVRQINRYYSDWWVIPSLLSKGLTKAILRGGFSFGIDSPFISNLRLSDI
jgi:hypothetical protein